ncbi:MAG: hypothetical protein LBG26_02915 [Treponema sp.]|jgi:hypothetical protein|nr:hypothetical protein [Treponema sp.]
MKYCNRQDWLFGRKKYIRLILLGFLISFVFISCKTPPEDVATDSVDDTTGPAVEDLNGPADAASLQVFEDARAGAEAARTRAQGVDAASYFPEDWDSAESRYGEADRAGSPATLGEARNRADEWRRITGVYDDLYGKALPLFAQDRAQQLLAAREAALDAGARDILPDRFDATDELAQSVQDKYDNGDYSGALADGTVAYDRYVVLKTIADAYALKQEADAYDFITYDPENYEAGADAGNQAVDLFDQGSLADAGESAGEAVNRFNLVLENGWIGYTNERSASAQSWRQAALEAKANVAVRNEYQNADRTYNEAHVALRAGNFAEAADLFERSGILFRQSRDAAVEKQVRAEEAIRLAEQKVSESEINARNAQEIIGDEE